MKENTGIKYRAVFISDLHLGSKHCDSNSLLNFIETLETEQLYLVGDIIDGWRLQRKWYWPKKHDKIVRKLIKKAKHSKTIYLTGNHDEFLRSINDVVIAGVPVENRTVHMGIDGKKYLVVHGDMFDNLMRTKAGRIVMHLGDFAYDSLILFNQLVNFTRKIFRQPPWSLAKFLKQKAKAAANFIGEFETQMVDYCKKKNYDGIICGHIHHAAIKHINGIVYMNDGDWCESCTALVEHLDGTWEIISCKDHS